MINIMHLRSSGGLFGAERVILSLARKADKSKFNTAVVCFKDPRDKTVELLEEADKYGIANKRIDLRNPFDLSSISRLRKLLREQEVDILHCHDYKANIAGYLATRSTDVRLIVTSHSADSKWSLSHWRIWAYELLSSAFIRHFDRIVAVSDFIYSETLAKKVSPGKAITIYNSVDLDRFQNDVNNGDLREKFGIGPKSKVIGTVGRLSTEKGYDYFLRAAKIVIEFDPSVVFLIAGDGRLREQLEYLSEELGIREKVIFTGLRQDIEDIYSMIDIFVSSSITEGLPLAILEAMAMGKPVIATNVGAVPKIVRHGRTGILLEPRDIVRLSKAIEDMVRSPGRAEMMAANGQNLVYSEFSDEVMVSKYEEVYDELSDHTILIKEFSQTG